MLTMSKQSGSGSLELVTPATTPLVTVAEMKAHGRLDTIPEGDDFMEALVEAATARAQDITRRAFLTEAWRLTMDNWPGAAVDEWWNGVREGIPSTFEATSFLIRKAPFLAVEAVWTVDEGGAETEWSSSNYFVTTEAGFGRVAKRQGEIWPLIVPPVRSVGGIRIQFTAGYGTDPTDVPAPIRQAVKMIAQHLYENREAQEIPNAAAMILSRYKVIG